MESLNDDVQIEILSYLSPSEIVLFGECFSKIMDCLAIHPGFIVNCKDKEIVSKNHLEWFQKHKIRINLWKYMTVDKNSIERWFCNDQLHRDDDLPAVIGINQFRVWYQNGLRHRDNDLPALILDGRQEWWKHGNLHRDHDLPAIKYPSGSCLWYQNGLKHRDNDLPAAIFWYDKREWWKNGEMIKYTLYELKND
jgi:hypothetical protein